MEFSDIQPGQSERYPRGEHRPDQHPQIHLRLHGGGENSKEKQEQLNLVTAKVH